MIHPPRSSALRPRTLYEPEGRTTLAAHVLQHTCTRWLSFRIPVLVRVLRTSADNKVLIDVPFPLSSPTSKLLLVPSSAEQHLPVTTTAVSAQIDGTKNRSWRIWGYVPLHTASLPHGTKKRPVMMLPKQAIRTAYSEYKHPSRSLVVCINGVAGVCVCVCKIANISKRGGRGWLVHAPQQQASPSG